MLRLASLTLAALFACVAVPGHAASTTFEYTGVVGKLYGTSGPSDPTDVTVGTPVTFSVTYDPSQVTAFGSLTLPNGMTGAPEKLEPVLASLYNQPQASYTITVSPTDGSTYTFTLADDAYDGYSTPSGIGPYPALAFNGTQIIGLESDAYVGDLEFYSDPAELLLQNARHAAYVYSTDPNSDYAFAVDTSLDAEIATIRDQALAAAQVPEPATIALLFGGLAVATRSRHKRRPDSARVGQPA